MGNKVIRLTDDDVFSWCFGREKQKQALIDLINNNKYDIEMQSYHEPLHVNRVLYYCSGLYSSQLAKNDVYHKLRPVIGVSFLRPILFSDTERFHHCFLLKEKDTHEILTEHIQLHFIELTKKSGSDTEQRLKDWQEFLTHEEDEKRMETLAKKSEAMGLAYQAYREFEQDSHLSDLHWARHERGQTYQQYIEDARYVWTQEGMEKGIEKGIEQTARAMIEKDFSLDQIIEITGLSAEELKNLK